MFSKRSSYFALLVLVSACGGDRSPSGLSSLVSVSEVDALQCPRGGYQVNAGVDNNRDKVLDAAEITSSWPVCVGVTGVVGVAGGGSLIDVAATPPDDSCPQGGVAVTVFFDANADGVADPDELALGTRVLHCSAYAADFAGLVFRSPQAASESRALYKVGADGGGLTKLAATASAAQTIASFAVSPDRKHVAFLAKMEAMAPLDLFVASLVSDASPVNASRLSDSTSEVLALAWSPDGARLAYVANAGAASDLFVVMADGTGRRRINENTNADRQISAVAWSPCGRWLAFVNKARLCNSTYYDSLYLSEPSLSSSPTQLDELESCSTASALDFIAWSPDQAAPKVAYMTRQDASHPILVVVASPLTPGAFNGSIDMGELTVPPAWDPSGAPVFTIAGRQQDFTSSGILTVGVSGSPWTLMQVDTTRSITSATWASDGAHIAYIEGDATTRRLRVIAPFAEAAVNVHENVEEDIGFDPTGQRLAYRAKTSAKISSLHSYAVVGTASDIIYLATTSFGVLGYAWSHDGTRLAYAVGDGPLGCAAAIRVEPSGGGDELDVLLPEGGARCVSVPAWSRDDATLAYVATPTAGGVATLFLASPDGQGAALEVLPFIPSLSIFADDLIW